MYQHPYCQGHNVNPLGITYFSSYKDFNDEEGGPRRRRHLGDDLRDLKVKALEFDSNLNP